MTITEFKTQTLTERVADWTQTYADTITENYRQYHMNTYEITFDEQYQLIKLYDLLRDTGMMEDLPKEIETFFEKLTY